jgi:hypothetical protein
MPQCAYCNSQHATQNPHVPPTTNQPIYQSGGLIRTPSCVSASHTRLDQFRTLADRREKRKYANGVASPNTSMNRKRMPPVQMLSSSSTGCAIGAADGGEDDDVDVDDDDDDDVDDDGTMSSGPLFLDDEPCVGVIRPVLVVGGAGLESDSSVVPPGVAVSLPAISCNSTTSL